MSHTRDIDDVDCGTLGNLTLRVEFSYSSADNGGEDYPSSREQYEILNVHIVLKDDQLIDISNLPTDYDDALVDMLMECR